MRDPVAIRQAVEQARKRHDLLASDRRMADEEINVLLVASYPTVNGQLN